MSELDAATFNPDAFMDMATEESTSTEYQLVPEGEYPAIISKVEMPKPSAKKDGSGFWYALNITYDIQDAAVAKEMDQERVTCRQSLFLDFKGSNLDMGKGKNVGLGRLRDALNMNSGTFSIRMLEGAGPLMVKVTHKEDKNGVNRANVTSVGKLT